MDIKTYTALAGGSVMVAAAAGAAAGTVYTDSAAFQAAAGGPLSVNGFDDLANGAAGDLAYSMDGFAYDIAADGGLMGMFGVVTTASSERAITIDLTGGGAVHAVGGNFWAMSELSPLTSEIILSMADGTTATMTSFGPEFRGFVSDVAITGMTITSDWSVLPANFNGSVALDNLSLGGAAVVVVPLPPTAWAGLGMLGLIGGARALRRRA